MLKCVWASVLLLLVSLQKAVMVRVGTEEDEEEEDDEKPSRQEQDVSYEMTNNKHSTLMSGERDTRPVSRHVWH